MNNTVKRIMFIRKLAMLTELASLGGISFIISCFNRTAEDQAERYAQGRTEPGKIVTYCDGYEKKSNHQDWLAVDIAIITRSGEIEWGRTEDYELLGRIWKEYIGGRWGGDWDLNDIYHFEWTGEGNE